MKETHRLLGSSLVLFSTLVSLALAAAQDQISDSGGLVTPSGKTARGASENLDDEARLVIYRDVLARFEEWSGYPPKLYIVDSAAVVGFLETAFHDVVPIVQLGAKEYALIKSGETKGNFVVVSLPQIDVQGDTAAVTAMITWLPSTAGMTSYNYCLKKVSGKWTIAAVQAGLQS